MYLPLLRSLFYILIQITVQCLTKVWSSQTSYLLNAGITELCHHTWLFFTFEHQFLDIRFFHDKFFSSFFPTFSQTLVCLLDDCHSNWGRWNLSVVLICISFMMNLFVLYSSFEKFLLSSFAYLLIGLFFGISFLTPFIHSEYSTFIQ
jgi:hypothetical protein